MAPLVVLPLGSCCCDGGGKRKNECGGGRGQVGTHPCAHAPASSSVYPLTTLTSPVPFCNPTCTIQSPFLQPAAAATAASLRTPWLHMLGIPMLQVHWSHHGCMQQCREAVGHPCPFFHPVLKSAPGAVTPLVPPLVMPFTVPILQCSCLPLS